MVFGRCLIALAITLACVYAMPYRVPLQGNEHNLKRTLVLLDEMGVMQSHSLFFENLKRRGHTLVFMQAQSPEMSLQKFGVDLYDNIVFFAPHSTEFNVVTFKDIHEFVDRGGNVLMAVDDSMSDQVRQFAEQSGVDFQARGFQAIDHFSNDIVADKSMLHTYVMARNHVQSGVILGDYLAAGSHPVLYHGVSHSMNEASVLSVKILQGNPSTYSADPLKPLEEQHVQAGAAAHLVSGVQARNNARLAFAGSLDLFSNDFMRTLSRGERVGNEEFTAAVSKWVFGESGVLRFRDIQHRKSDGTPPDVILHEKERPDLPQSLYPDPEIARNSLVYRIKDDIVYTMVVEEYVNNEWKPFVANDMQMEFVMLDPHVRKTMTSDAATGTFTAAFTAPDNYGIFKFRVLYRRTGYSVLHAETQVSIRPFKHNEYERFISSAYPYYASALSAVIAFFVFCFIFMMSADDSKRAVVAK